MRQSDKITPPQSEAAGSDDDCRWMKLALDEAGRAAAEGEVPIGAVIVAEGRVLGRGHNMTEALSDVTAHAEMIALTAACQAAGGKYLPRATLYVTVEPCVMCAGALAWGQLGRIVYGAPDAKRGYTRLRAAVSPFHKSTVIRGGVMQEECAAVISDFFRGLRRR